MSALINLPGYEVPKNALLDLGSINGAIDFSAQQSAQAFKAKQDTERLGMEQTRFQNEQQDRDAMKLARGALVVHNIDTKDPRRQQVWQRLVQSDPRISSELQKYGVDPNDHVQGPQFILSEAGKYDPLKELATKAQIASSQAGKYGTIKEDQQLYVKDPSSPNGVRFIEPPNAGGIGGNKKFGDEAAKAQVERLSGMVKAGDQQMSSVSDLNMLREIGGRIGDPSAALTIKRTLGPYARAIGIDINGMSEIEAFTSIVSRVAPTMRPAGSGATSDFEFKQYLQSLPALAQTAQGRKLITDQLEAFSQHSIKQREIASKIINGEIPRQQGEQMLRALPDPMTLFRQSQPAIGGGSTSKGPSVQPGQTYQFKGSNWRFKGGDPSRPESWEQTQ